MMFFHQKNLTLFFLQFSERAKSLMFIYLYLLSYTFGEKIAIIGGGVAGHFTGRYISHRFFTEIFCCMEIKTNLSLLYK